MPTGYLITVGVVAVGTLLTLLAPRRPQWLGNLAFTASIPVGETPLYAGLWLVASTLLLFLQGDAASPAAWVGMAAAALTLGGLAVGVVRAARTGQVLDHALDRVLVGSDTRHVRPAAAARHLELLRTLVFPLPLRPRTVEKLRNVRYGEDSRAHRMDIYRHRGAGRTLRPAFVYFHGGGFHSGRKGKEALALMYHLARRGWLCITADYHLSRSPGEGHPRHLIDAKRVVAWVRAHSDAYGVDPNQVFVAGTSAGAHLATMLALTPNHPDYQPGFERADTSVAAAIGFAGYYGYLDGDRSRPTSPSAWLHPGAPPMLLIHGDRDTVVPASRAHAFAEEASRVSRSPVVYAELPGGHHAFDLFGSPRYSQTIRGVEQFANWVLEHSVSAAE